MPILGNNLLTLVACWVLTVIVGAYVTFFKQPDELEQVQKAEQVVRLKQDEVSSLLTEAASSKEMADDAVARWRARYKVIPATLTSHEVVGYLNELTAAGFKNFDIALNGVQRHGTYSYYTFNVTGRAYYSSLYRFVWENENNRDFYRSRDLTLEHIDLFTPDEETGNERMQVMVSFSMNLDAFFGGPEGASAPDSMAAMVAGKLPPVPMDVLPTPHPVANPFFPVVMEQLPPNTHGLIDLQKASLVGIVGNKAVFHDEKGHRQVGVGDAVYLGHITAVDASTGKVSAVLNLGGIIDEVELNLHTPETYRQALGPMRVKAATE